MASHPGSVTPSRKSTTSFDQSQSNSLTPHTPSDAAQYSLIDSLNYNDDRLDGFNDGAIDDTANPAANGQAVIGSHDIDNPGQLVNWSDLLDEQGMSISERNQGAITDDSIDANPNDVNEAQGAHAGDQPAVQGSRRLWRANLERYGAKEHTWPKLKGTAGVMLGGAAGAATGALAAGGTAGVVALVSTITLGAVGGAAVGSAVPVVGTIIGAVVGIGLGIAWAIRAKSRQADTLDTSTRSTARTFQRNTCFAWARAADPTKITRGILRKIPLVSTRRAALVRAGAAASSCCFPIEPSRKLEFEDPGRPATIDESQRNLRYCVASKMVYGGQTLKNDGMGMSSDAFAQRAVDRKERYLDKSNPNDRDKQLLSMFQNYAAPFSGQNSMPVGAPDKGWNFTPISSNEHPMTRAGGVFEKLKNDPRMKGLAASLDDNGVFHDPDTGNKIKIMYDEANSEVVIAYSGTGSPEENQKWTQANQVMGNWANYAGGVTPSLHQAVMVGAAVREAVAQWNDENPHATIDNVVSTGHSRGGMQAGIEAWANGGKAVTFNPEPWGGGVREWLGALRSNVAPPGTDITNFSARHDWVSGNSVASAIGTTIETVAGLPVPVIPGKRLILARAPGATSTHASMLDHMAYRAGGGPAAPTPIFRGKPPIAEPLDVDVRLRAEQA